MRCAITAVVRHCPPAPVCRGGRWGLLLATLGLAAGCTQTVIQTTPTMRPPPGSTMQKDDGTTVTVGTATPDTKGLTADDAAGSDASASRLHDIEGLLMLYYRLHRQLPPRLEDLKPLADIDVDGGMQFTAPSGQPYIYAPAGLVAPTASLRIIVADPAPSASGARWCILMPTPPANPRAPLNMEVISFPEQAFKQYAPAD